MSIRLVTNDAGLVVNVVAVDAATPADWHPGPGLTLLPEEVTGAIGGTYIDGRYTPPPDPDREGEDEE